MRVRRGYLIALLVVAAAGVGGLFDRGAVGDAPLQAQLQAQQAAQTQARRGLPEAMAALARLQVPPGARLLTRGCRWYRCYLIEKPTGQAASTLPVIMRSLGADNPQTRRLQAAMWQIESPIEGDAAAALKGLGIPGGSASKIAGCGEAYNRAHGLVATCAEPAVIDGNVIGVFLGPYLPCQPEPCRWTGETEVEITFPSGAPQAAG